MNNIEQSLTSAITKAVNDVYGMEPQADPVGGDSQGHRER